jgi:hypothetical protein
VPQFANTLEVCPIDVFGLLDVKPEVKNIFRALALQEQAIAVPLGSSVSKAYVLTLV